MIMVRLRMDGIVCIAPVPSFPTASTWNIPNIPALHFAGRIAPRNTSTGKAGERHASRIRSGWHSNPTPDDEMEDIMEIGQWILVPFGTGTQKAVYLGDSKSPGKIRVKKWSAKGRRFTKPMLIPRTGVIRSAEKARFAP